MNNQPKLPAHSIWVFRTSLVATRDVQKIGPLLDQLPAIHRWNVCLDDCDKILRIEAGSELEAATVMSLLHRYGYDCEELPD